MRRIMGTALAVVAAAGLLAAAGCGGSDEPSQTEANATLCASAATLTGTLDQVTDLQQGSVTRDQLSSLGDQITSAWDGFTQALSSAADADQSAVDSAWDATKAALEAVPGSDSVQTALQGVQATIPPLEEAIKGVTPDCPAPTTTGGATTG